MFVICRHPWHRYASGRLNHAPASSVRATAAARHAQHCSHIGHCRTPLYCRRHNLRSMNTVRTSIPVECLPTVGGTTCARATQSTQRSPPNVSLLSAAQLVLVQHSPHSDLRRTSLYCRGATCARTPQFTHRSPPNAPLLSAAQLALDERSSHIDPCRTPLYCRRHNLRSHTNHAVNPAAARPPAHPISTAPLAARPTGKKHRAPFCRNQKQTGRPRRPK